MHIVPLKSCDKLREVIIHIKRMETCVSLELLALKVNAASLRMT